MGRWVDAAVRRCGGAAVRRCGGVAVRRCGGRRRRRRLGSRRCGNSGAWWHCITPEVRQLGFQPRARKAAFGVGSSPSRGDGIADLAHAHLRPSEIRAPSSTLMGIRYARTYTPRTQPRLSTCSPRSGCTFRRPSSSTPRLGHTGSRSGRPCRCLQADRRPWTCYRRR